jgi:hypothetical protein
VLLLQPFQSIPAVCGNCAWLRGHMGLKRELQDTSLHQAEWLLLDVQDTNIFHRSVFSACQSHVSWQTITVLKF